MPFIVYYYTAATNLVFSAKRRIGPCGFEDEFMCGYNTTAVTTDAAMWIRKTDRAFFDALEDAHIGFVLIS